MNDTFTIGEVSHLLEFMHLAVPSEYVISYWRKKKWLTTKGKPILSLSIAVNVANSAFLTEQRKLKGEPTQNLKRVRKMQKEKKKLDESKITSYNNQLQDKRWLAFREYVFAARGRKCERCGSEQHLQIHHPKYISGRAAWEYTCLDVMVLCSVCHMKTHNIIIRNK